MENKYSPCHDKYAVNNVVINPLTSILEDLNDADGDYNFVPHKIDVNEGLTDGKLTSLPNAVDLTKTHIEKVIVGEDQDSVSTLGGMTTQSKSKSVPRTIGEVARLPLSGVSVSDQSYATMDSRVSQLEEKISNMEVNITNSLNASMESLFTKFLSNGSPASRGATGKRKAL